ncbi:MAG TPA: TIGR03936 family radical SAM-associated protein [Acidimicrobiales bacterium]|nr:TIGR03936 family radical SAM-associated protein [Acidimicrobiales bacterium]
MTEIPAVRLRFRFTKTGKIRFTSHRDVARMWERAFWRSRLPIVRSQGFNPHPLLSFGLALPTGCESLGEYLDARVDEAAYDPSSLATLPEQLSDLLPEGMVVQAVARVGMAEGSLQQEVASCDWELEVLGVVGEELEERIERALAAPSLTVQRERKGRQTEDDIRPAVLALALTQTDGSTQGEYPVGRIKAHLATHPRGVRPSDLLSAFGTDVVLARACRTHQWIERDGARFEPLTVSGLGTDPVVEHAQGRAS